jgi:hypothetical protein
MWLIFYGTRMFTTVSVTAQSSPHHSWSFSLKSILILSSQLILSLPNVPFLSGLPTKIFPCVHHVGHSIFWGTFGETSCTASHTNCMYGRDPEILLLTGSETLSCCSVKSVSHNSTVPGPDIQHEIKERQGYRERQRDIYTEHKVLVSLFKIALTTAFISFCSPSKRTKPQSGKQLITCIRYRNPRTQLSVYS